MTNNNIISNNPYSIRDIISDTLYDEAHIRNEYGEDSSVDNSDEVADIIIEKLKHYGYEIRKIENE